MSNRVKLHQKPCRTGITHHSVPAGGDTCVPSNFVPQLLLPEIDTLLQEHATRVAISPIFAVPYVEPCFGVPRDATSHAQWVLKEMAQCGLSLGYDVCVACGKRYGVDRDGRPKNLMSCGRCGGVKYCSKECQKKDWNAGHRVKCERRN